MKKAIIFDLDGTLLNTNLLIKKYNTPKMVPLIVF